MTTPTTVELRAEATRFFSNIDEVCFFGWLKKLPCISMFEGRGDTLYIRVAGPDVDEEALRELLALFHRYGIDMKQLRIFDKEDFAGWLHNKKAYWYRPMFGSL
jgi:hypothetical protein